MSRFDGFRRKQTAAAPDIRLTEVWSGFQQVLAENHEVLGLMGDLEEMLVGRRHLDIPYLKSLMGLLDQHVAAMVAALQNISRERRPELDTARRRVSAAMHQRLEAAPPFPSSPLMVRLEEAGPEVLPALGGKAANLVRVKNQLGLPVPDGVVATLSAYKLFMEQRLPDQDDTLLSRLKARLTTLDLRDEGLLKRRCRELQDLVLAQPIPPELADTLIQEARRLASEGDHSLTVRSSGGREDLEASFAGQYETFLAVAPSEVPQRWRQVVASQFREGAVIYGKLQGLLLEEAAMGVLIQRLAPARSAGVMAPTDAFGGKSGYLLVSAAWGLAADLVAGRMSGDEYLVAKDTGRLVQGRYARKTSLLQVRNGRLEQAPVAPELVEAPALELADLERLAAFARVLEAHCGCPHCLEWVKDFRGEIYVVQSRHMIPADMEVNSPQIMQAMAEAAAGAQVLLHGRVGSPGVAAGPVFHLRNGRSPAETPRGVVLVAPRTTPELAPVLPRIAALVTAAGSATGHLMLVAREYGVPALVDAVSAANLPERETVTVDAYGGKVYQGRVEDLLRYETAYVRHCPDSPVLARVRAVADLILPLHLEDRGNPKFRPEHCRTYHDLIRFAQEEAIQVMCGLMDDVAQGRVPAVKILSLQTPLPLNLHLVDLGDGLASSDASAPPEELLCRPLRALWRGLSYPGISWTGAAPMHGGGFPPGAGQSDIKPLEEFGNKTYAIVAANYVHYAGRRGRHFQSVDSYLGDLPANNHINFTCTGAAADEASRSRLIAAVLERLGFTLEISEDVIRAGVRRLPAPKMESRLDSLGRLMVYVGLMDMPGQDEHSSQVMAERFLAGHYDRPGEREKSPEGGD